ncbi:MAG TPA: OB-fold domain-containing protein [Acidimicrobiia bacterium]|jgi:hypothetical protein|nr:OB-fold domain-containing protein [Acidimicrobiia bacterium]
MPEPTPLPAFVEPTIDVDSAPFWKAARDGELLLQRCTGCGTYRWPLRTVCWQCAGRDAAEVPATGRGTVASWIVVHQPTVPTPPELLPYTIALVALEEDGRILVPGLLVGDGTGLDVGAAVVADFQSATAEIAVLGWRLSAPTTHSPTTDGPTTDETEQR